MDTFDPKPALQRYAGKVIAGGTGGAKERALPSPFTFRPAGKSGLLVSEIFPELAKHADKLCIIRSMHTDEPAHEQAQLFLNTGALRLARPSLGAWTVYGLGSENQNLPAFVVLKPGSYPLGGAANWQASFLPGNFAGTYVDTEQSDLERLIPYIRNHYATQKEQSEQLGLLRNLTKAYQERLQADATAEARLQSAELAFRMQAAATDAFDLSKEPEKVRERYGDSAQGRQLLLARRLLERDVRFVQAWHDGWDSHEDIKGSLKNLGQESDKATAALLQDLKDRGLLDDTLVVWGGEFGRTPSAQSPEGEKLNNYTGRDHNHKGFSVWLAGGGVQGGLAYGATDELGFAAVQNPVHVHDLHATILNLLGLDHTKLTYRYAGRDFRLTDVSGNVITGVFA